jgi:hypothetical protein
VERAKERGYQPQQDPRILEHHVVDGSAISANRGRPREIDESIEERLLDLVISDRSGREKSSDVLAYETGISSSSALRVLHHHGLNSVKPTRKPGLNEAQRKARLEFCLAHKDWTLEDWKNVIWSDETSVVLTKRGQQRVWRGPNEAFEKSVIRRRWKGYSEFMFWGCFTYDLKGPCHIWEPETAKEREEAIKEVEELNCTLEPECQERWESEQRELEAERAERGGRRRKTPQWKFTEKTGKLVRRGKGGVDWYRYWKVYSHLSYFLLILQLTNDSRK